MRKFSIRFIVAVLAFAVGTIISSLSRFSSPQTLEPTAAQRNSELRESTLNESETEPLEIYAPADLSIVIKQDSDPLSFTVRTITLSNDRPTTVDLELDEDIDDQEV